MTGGIDNNSLENPMRIRHFKIEIATPLKIPSVAAVQLQMMIY